MYKSVGSLMSFAFTMNDRLPLLNNQSYHYIKYLFADYLSQCNFDNNQQTLTCNPELILDKHAPPIVHNNSNINEASSSSILVICLISDSSQRKDPLLEIFNETFTEEQTKYSYHAYVNKILKKGFADLFFFFNIYSD